MKISSSMIYRSIIISDYVPLKLRAEKEYQATDYFYVRKADSSLLEIAFDTSDSTICRITLLLCENFQRIDEDFISPDNVIDGDILIDTTCDIESPMFNCKIYQNAVKIEVSDEETCKVVSSGNVLWELSEKGNLVALCVIDPSGRMSEHCFNELSSD